MNLHHKVVMVPRLSDLNVIILVNAIILPKLHDCCLVCCFLIGTVKTEDRRFWTF